MILLRIAAVLTHTHIEPQWPRGKLERAALAAELAPAPEKQLVLVSYGANHNVDSEWVWNSAEIDRSKVVWARDMGKTANQELLNYFKDRRLWCVNGDTSPAQLESCEHSQ
jgi:hypothetical protein